MSALPHTRRTRPFIALLLAASVVALLFPASLRAEEPPLIPTWSWDQLPCESFPFSSYTEYAMQVDENGRLHIVCFQEGDGSLYYLTGVPGKLTKEVIDAPGQVSLADAAVGGYPSLVLDGDGLPHVAYLTYYSYEKFLGHFGPLRALRYGVRTPTGWVLEDVEVASPSDGVVRQGGRTTALALHADGAPVIMYERSIALEGGTSVSQVRELLKSEVGWFRLIVNMGALPISRTPALVSAADGHIYAAFTWYNREAGRSEGVGYAVMDGPQWRSTLVEEGANVPWNLEFAAAPDGRVAFAYTFDQEPLARPLRLAVIADSEVTTTTVATTSHVAAISLAFDGKGQPALAISDWGSESLTHVYHATRGWTAVQVRRYYDMGLPAPVLRYHGDTAYLLYRAPREGVTLIGTLSLQPAKSVARLPLIMQKSPE